jgi:hypothetical protein
MQHGSMIRTERQQGPDVWEFRWREPSPDGRRKHRRMVVGSVDEFTNELAARQAIVGLRLDINPRDARVKAGPITVSELTVKILALDYAVPGNRDSAIATWQRLQGIAPAIPTSRQISRGFIWLRSVTWTQHRSMRLRLRQIPPMHTHK